MIKAPNKIKRGELYKAAHALVNHLNKMERLRGGNFPDTFINPANGKMETNALMVPVGLLNKLKKHLEG